MLVLTRRHGEAVIVEAGGVAIRVVVVGISGNQIRLGFDAPRSVHVVREEIVDKAPKKKEVAELR